MLQVDMDTGCSDHGRGRSRVTSWGLWPALLAACAGGQPTAADPLPVVTEATVCAVTEPEWLEAPDDAAVDGDSGAGYYYVNKNRSIWVAAWWQRTEAKYLRAGKGLKTGWFRPAGADLAVSGIRLDGEAPPLDAHFPCCYPTRFQASGLSFPTEGCWEVHASAAGSELTFVVQVYP